MIVLCSEIPHFLNPQNVGGNSSHFRDENQFRKLTLDHPDDYREIEISAILILLYERPLAQWRVKTRAQFWLKCKKPLVLRKLKALGQFNWWC